MLCFATLIAASSTYSFRLNPREGETFDFALRVEREKPSQVGELHEHVVIDRRQAGIVMMHVQISGLTIDGVDRKRDLNAILGGQTVDLPWTELSWRTGDMTPLHLNPGPADLMSYLAEAGIYACSFRERPVKIGDRWAGSVTATGGCTSGNFTLKSVGKTTAEFEVTEIEMANCVQVGPMRMTVDLASGLPIDVAYTVRGNKSGRLFRFSQRMIRRK